MAYDAKHLLSSSQAVTASAASTNILDLGSGKDAFLATRIRDIGKGDPLYVHFNTVEAAAASGSATVTFAIEGADNEAMDSGLVTLAATGATGKATLVAGKRVSLMVPPENQKRYMRAYYTVATGPLTAGKFTAWLGGEA